MRIRVSLLLSTNAVEILKQPVGHLFFDISLIGLARFQRRAKGLGISLFSKQDRAPDCPNVAFFCETL